MGMTLNVTTIAIKYGKVEPKSTVVICIQDWRKKEINFKVLVPSWTWLLKKSHLKARDELPLPLSFE